MTHPFNPRAGETDADYGRRVRQFLMEVGDGDKEPTVDLDGAVLRRMVRLETRVTVALRYLGLVPGKDNPDHCAGRVVYDKNRAQLVVTSPDVPLYKINEAAALSGHIGDLEVVVCDRLWGVIHMRQRARSTT